MKRSWTGVSATTPEQFYNLVSTEVALEGAEYVTAILEIMAKAGLVGTAAILCAASRVCAGAVVYSTPELAPLAPWIVGPAAAYGGTRVLNEIGAAATTGGTTVLGLFGLAT